MKQERADQVRAAALAFLLLTAFVFGGGGSRYGLANLTVQLCALVLLAAHPTSFARFWKDAPLGLRVLTAASVAMPLLQIVPLPPSWWGALPGRDLVGRSLELVDTSAWMTMSLDPRRTLLALTALIVPLAVLAAGWSLPRQRLVQLGWLVVGLGIVTTVIGALQASSGNPALYLFPARNVGDYMVGTFANRNSTALLLVFALTLVAVLPPPRPHPLVLPVRIGLAVLLIAAIVLTQSRTGLVLAALPLGLWALHAILQAGRSRGRAHGPVRGKGAVLLGVATLALVVGGVATASIQTLGRVSETLARFEAKDNPRRYIWDDASYSVARYWPAGAGMGTFDEVFQVDESLENMTVRRAGRAHNDYIEIAIEAGLAGLILAAAWIIMLAWLAWLARRSPQRWTAWGGGTFLLAVVLQSITDYPLRSMTLLALSGFALLLLARGASDRQDVRP